MKAYPVTDCDTCPNCYIAGDMNKNGCHMNSDINIEYDDLEKIHPDCLLEDYELNQEVIQEWIDKNKTDVVIHGVAREVAVMFARYCLDIAYRLGWVDYHSESDMFNQFTQSDEYKALLKEEVDLVSNGTFQNDKDWNTPPLKVPKEEVKLPSEDVLCGCGNTATVHRCHNCYVDDLLDLGH